MSGRAQRCNVDRITFTQPGKIATAQSTSTPESSTDSATTTPTTVIMKAIEFTSLSAGVVPFYIDGQRLAVDAANIAYRNVWAAATKAFPGTTGTYNVIFSAMYEGDGESKYALKIGSDSIGYFQCPSAYTGNTQTIPDYTIYKHTFSGVTIANGATVKAYGMTNSNGLVPEGTGFANSRGRWTQLEFVPTTVVLPSSNVFIKASTGVLTSGMSNATTSGAISTNAISGTTGNMTGPAVSDSKATYSVTLAAGHWYAWARTLANDDNSNSFWIQVDNGVAVRIGNNQTFGSWVWEQNQGVKVDLGTLTAGTHTITITVREPGCKLDVICLTTTTSYTPVDGDVDFNLPSSVFSRQNLKSGLGTQCLMTSNTLKLSGIKTGIYTLNIYSLNGRTLLTTPVRITESGLATVPIGTKLNQGVYAICVQGKGFSMQQQVTILR